MLLITLLGPSPPNPLKMVLIWVTRLPQWAWTVVTLCLVLPCNPAWVGFPVLLVLLRVVRLLLIPPVWVLTLELWCRLRCPTLELNLLRRLGRLPRCLLLPILAITQEVKQTMCLRLPGAMPSRQLRWEGIFPKN